MPVEDEKEQKKKISNPETKRNELNFFPQQKLKLVDVQQFDFAV